MPSGDSMSDDHQELSPLFERPAQEELDRLELAWRECRSQNPRLMPALHELCHQAKARGYTNWSVGALFEVLRWQTALTTGDLGLKINNNHRALAARDLMAEYPELDGFFRTRERKPRPDNWGQIH